MTASSLIDISRSRLGDEDKHRWTDNRLLTIIDQGQKDFCKLSGVYRKITVIPLSLDDTRYALPNDTMTINRIEYMDEIIPIFSRNDIDKSRVTGKDFVGIKDNLDMNILEIYPHSPTPSKFIIDIRTGLITDDNFILDTPYGVVTAITAPYALDSVYGVVADTSYDLELLEHGNGFGEVCDTSDTKPYVIGNTVYGVVTGMETLVSSSAHKGFITSSDIYEVIGKYGLTTSIVHIEGYIRVFYTAIPLKVSVLTQELVLHDMWEAAMVRYIVGTALQDDNDSNNMQRGELELSKYLVEVKKAEDLTSKDFSRGQPDKMTTRYRSI